MKVLAALGCIALLSLAAIACSSNDDEDSGTQTPSSLTPTGTGGSGLTIDATEREYEISLGHASVEEGDVTFEVENQGTMTHEFVVVKTDLMDDQLPQKEGVVDEDSNQLEVVDEIEDVKAGGTESLTVDLSPGHYVVLCNISGHYQLGMRSDLQVKPGSAQAAP